VCKYWSVSFKELIDNIYIFVLRQYISSWTIGSIWNFLFDNRESMYTCFAKHILNHVVYVKPCFVMFVESNIKQSKIKLCAQCKCVLQLIILRNMLIWEGLPPTLFVI
jgi:hypothetical protein